MIQTKTGRAFNLDATGHDDDVDDDGTSQDQHKISHSPARNTSGAA